MKGNRREILISKETASSLSLREGEYFEVVRSGDRVVLRLLGKLIKEDKEVLNWTRKFIELYGSSLEELAKN